MSSKDKLIEKKDILIPIPKTPVLENIVMSISIFGHGCENLTSPWTKDNPISTFFKNNVRVYSKSCVPDVISIGSILENKDIIRDVQHRFSEVPESETESIIKKYADEVKMEYIRDIAFNKLSKTKASLHTGFDKASDIQNLARVSSLSTFLSNKNFNFDYDNSSKEIPTSTYKQAYKTLGVQVTDIRLKVTYMDGSVIYKQLFNPTDSHHTDSDFTNFNLIYKNGLTYILKEVLNNDELVKPALDIFGFTKKQRRIMDLSLEQLYYFFQLLGVEYVNIMDYTCRSCSIGSLPQDLTDKIYNVEQKFKDKPVAFGTRFSKKKNKNKKHKKSKKSLRRLRSV